MTLSESPCMTIYRRGSASGGGDPARTVVSVHGDHDTTTSAALSLTLLDAARLDGGDLVVDLSCVEFMDASIVSTLVAVRDHLAVASCTLSVRNPSPRARRVLELCGLEGLIDAPAEVERPVGPAGALRTWVAVAPTDPPHGSSELLVAELAARPPPLASAAVPPTAADP